MKRETISFSEFRERYGHSWLEIPALGWTLQVGYDNYPLPPEVNGCPASIFLKMNFNRRLTVADCDLEIEVFEDTAPLLARVIELHQIHEEYFHCFVLNTEDILCYTWWADGELRSETVDMVEYYRKYYGNK